MVSWVLPARVKSRKNYSSKQWVARLWCALILTKRSLVELVLCEATPSLWPSHVLAEDLDSVNSYDTAGSSSWQVVLLPSSPSGWSYKISRRRKLQSCIWPETVLRSILCLISYSSCLVFKVDVTRKWIFLMFFIFSFSSGERWKYS